MRGGPDPVAEAAPPPFGRRPESSRPLAAPDYRAVPVEMVLYQANATGQMFLRRDRERGARFKPDARVWRVEDRLVGEVLFEAPLGPERQQGRVVRLTTCLWENLS